jgi:uncharacterized protein YprB with RNaseH-like and TPR domain
MKKDRSVQKKLDEVRSLMDRKGLPRGLAGGRKKRPPLTGVKVREEIFPSGYRHGHVLLEDLHRFDGTIFRYLGEGCEAFDPREAVFLDTETTGLAGGAGTYAFLVGIGFFDDRGFVVKQFLMPELAEEKEMLTLLADELRPFRSIVTFNGRTFDLPLLETRYILKGVRPDWGWDPHLDLLPVSRRLWRGHFESCRLGCLEEEVLGFFRGEDIPGYAIPPLYVRFLREQRLSLLEPVLTHNRWDIASLAALAASICGIVESGVDLSLEEGSDFAAAARVFASADDEDLSLECYREAFIRELPDERRLSTGLALGRNLKSRGLLEEAAKVWEELREEYPRDRTCRIELAKYREHGEKDFSAALECAVEALKIVRRECLSRGSGTAPRTLEAECERRVERLRDKRSRGVKRRGTKRAGQ